MTQWEKLVQVFHPTAFPTKFQPKLSLQPGLLPHCLISWHMGTASPLHGRFSFFFFSPPKHYTFTTVFTSRSSSSWFSCRKRETAKYPIKESSLHYYFQAISYFMSETLRLSVTQEELIQTVTKTQQKNPVW